MSTPFFQSKPKVVGSGGLQPAFVVRLHYLNGQIAVNMRSNFVLNEWTRVAMVYDMSTNTASQYINGALVTEDR